MNKKYSYVTINIIVIQELIWMASHRSEIIFEIMQMEKVVASISSSGKAVIYAYEFMP